jgi:quinol monooxygenase YgiN
MAEPARDTEATVTPEDICRLLGGEGVCRPMMQGLIRIVAPHDKREEVVDVLTCLKGPTEVASGCRACRVLQDADDSRLITYLVQWDTEEAMAEHLRSERFRRLLPYIEMSVEPPEVDFSTIGQVRGVEFLVAAIGAPSGWRGSQAAQDR